MITKGAEHLPHDVRLRGRTVQPGEENAQGRRLTQIPDGGVEETKSSYPWWCSVRGKEAKGKN